jgi:hypothetical protein
MGKETLGMLDKDVRSHFSSVQGWLGILIGSVWVFHGLYSKILDGIPRHKLIVSRILGDDIGGPATLVIGSMEILLGLWAFSGWQRRACAAVQTLAILSMNSLEIYLANDLLISAIGMLVLNAAFITVIWYWALAKRSTEPTRLHATAGGE